MLPQDARPSNARSVDDIISVVIANESPSYTDDPKDSGGPTKYGITQAALSIFLNRAASAADVRALTETDARAIYRQRYVELPGFGALLGVSRLVAAEVIDTGVHVGQSLSATMLQRALNALNRNERDYADVRTDGQCGPRTVAALRAFLERRGAEGERVLLAALDCLQGEHYIRLAEGRPKDEEYVYGWLRARVA